MSISRLYLGDEQYNCNKDKFIVSVTDRVRFYIICNNVYLVPVEDTRPMPAIFEETVATNNTETSVSFDQIIRGFMRESEICICKGSNLGTVSTDEIFGYWNELLNAHFSVYYHSEADIALWTGCVIGHDGCMTRPNRLLGKVTKLGAFVKCC